MILTTVYGSFIDGYDVEQVIVRRSADSATATNGPEPAPPPSVIERHLVESRKFDEDPGLDCEPNARLCPIPTDRNGTAPEGGVSQAKFGPLMEKRVVQ